MALDLSMAADAMLDAFGEMVEYRKVSGAIRHIVAVVNRNPAAPLDVDPDALRPNIVIVVKNSAQEGIAMTELETSTDRLLIPKRKGDTTNEELSVNRVTMQNTSLIRLELV